MLITWRFSARASVAPLALVVAIMGATTANAQVESQAVGGAQPQNAQTQNAQDRAGFDEIVVTARRVAENLQEVPVVVTALSGEALKEQNILAPTDLQFAAPSVTVQGGLTRLGGSYSVRGVNAGVVSYFSEAPTGPTTIGMPFFDLQSVQVLNGPQGTLFGRTAAAGAILVTPEHPDLNSTGGYIDVSVGDYGRFQGTGVVNVPVVEGELAIRLAYNREHIDGYTTQFEPHFIVPTLPGTPSVGRKLDEVNNDSVRVGVEWRRGDFKNYAVFSYLNVNQAGSAHVLSYANPNLASLNLASRAILKQNVVAELDRINNGGSVRLVPAMQGQEAYDRLRMKHVVDIAEYDFGEIGGFTTLAAKNVFSYQEFQAVTGGALDGVGGILVAYNSCSQIQYACNAGLQQYSTNDGTVILPGFGEEVETITEEFQLQGTAAEFINWTAGYFYSRVKEPFQTGVPSISRINSGIGNASFPFPNGSKTTERAPYGQVTFDLDKLGIHGLSITAGYRDTKTKSSIRTRGIVTNPDFTIVPGAPNPESVLEFGGSNYTFGITEEISPDLMVYATHSKSFTPGGENITAGCEVAPGCNRFYSPATVKSYELGVKSQFNVGDASMRLNGAIYRLDFSDIQQTLRYTDETFALIYVANVASARINGAEIQLDAQLQNLDLSLGYSYNDAKFTNWVATDINNVRLPAEGSGSTLGPNCQPGSAGSTCLIDLSGNPFQNAPKHQLRGSIRYSLPIGDGNGDAWIQLNGYYQSRQWHTAAPFRELEIAQFFGLGDVTDAISQKPYGTLNLRVGWDNIAQSRLSAAVFVNNLTNTTYSQAGSTRAYSLGTTVRLYAPPRMWGVNLRYEFGD
jgi:iron complex outermembrane receptor protein